MKREGLTSADASAADARDIHRSIGGGFPLKWTSGWRDRRDRERTKWERKGEDIVLLRLAHRRAKWLR